jgi:hypothetical protein
VSHDGFPVHASKRDSSVKPDAGNPLVRFEEGGGGRLCLPLRYSTVLGVGGQERGRARNDRGNVRSIGGMCDQVSSDGNATHDAGPYEYNGQDGAVLLFTGDLQTREGRHSDVEFSQG